jgi:hypothetical protein
MVIVVPAMVATAVFELVYVYPPVLLEVGGVIVNAEFPIIFVGTEKLVRTGVPLFTVRVEVVVAAK